MRLLDGESSGLLCVPLPWEEGDNTGAAVMIYESRALAQAGLDHYLALPVLGTNAGRTTNAGLFVRGLRLVF